MSNAILDKLFLEWFLNADPVLRNNRSRVREQFESFASFVNQNNETFPSLDKAQKKQLWERMEELGDQLLVIQENIQKILTDLPRTSIEKIVDTIKFKDEDKNNLYRDSIIKIYNSIIPQIAPVEIDIVEEKIIDDAEPDVDEIGDDQNYGQPSIPDSFPTIPSQENFNQPSAFILETLQNLEDVENFLEFYFAAPQKGESFLFNAIRNLLIISWMTNQSIGKSKKSAKEKNNLNRLNNYLSTLKDWIVSNISRADNLYTKIRDDLAESRDKMLTKPPREFRWGEGPDQVIYIYPGRLEADKLTSKKEKKAALLTLEQLRNLAKAEVADRKNFQKPLGTLLNSVEIMNFLISYYENSSEIVLDPYLENNKYFDQLTTLFKSRWISLNPRERMEFIKYVFTTEESSPKKLVDILLNTNWSNIVKQVVEKSTGEDADADADIEEKKEKDEKEEKTKPKKKSKKADQEDETAEIKIPYYPSIEVLLSNFIEQLSKSYSESDNNCDYVRDNFDDILMYDIVAQWSQVKLDGQEVLTERKIVRDISDKYNCPEFAERGFIKYEMLYNENENDPELQKTFGRHPILAGFIRRGYYQRIRNLMQDLYDNPDAQNQVLNSIKASSDINLANSVYVAWTSNIEKWLEELRTVVLGKEQINNYEKDAVIDGALIKKGVKDILPFLGATQETKKVQQDLAWIRDYYLNEENRKYVYQFLEYLKFKGVNIKLAPNEIKKRINDLFVAKYKDELITEEIKNLKRFIDTFIKYFGKLSEIPMSVNVKSGREGIGFLFFSRITQLPLQYRKEAYEVAGKLVNVISEKITEQRVRTGRTPNEVRNLINQLMSNLLFTQDVPLALETIKQIDPTKILREKWFQSTNKKLGKMIDDGEVQENIAEIDLVKLNPESELYRTVKTAKFINNIKDSLIEALNDNDISTAITAARELKSQIETGLKEDIYMRNPFISTGRLTRQRLLNRNKVVDNRFLGLPKTVQRQLQNHMIKSWLRLPSRLDRSVLNEGINNLEWHWFVSHPENKSVRELRDEDSKDNEYYLQSFSDRRVIDVVSNPQAKRNINPNFYIPTQKWWLQHFIENHPATGDCNVDNLKTTLSSQGGDAQKFIVGLFNIYTGEIKILTAADFEEECKYLEELHKQEAPSEMTEEQRLAFDTERLDQFKNQLTRKFTLLIGKQTTTQLGPSTNLTSLLTYQIIALLRTLYNSLGLTLSNQMINQMASDIVESLIKNKTIGELSECYAKLLAIINPASPIFKISEIVKSTLIKTVGTQWLQTICDRDLLTLVPEALSLDARMRKEFDQAIELFILNEANQFAVQLFNIYNPRNKITAIIPSTQASNIIFNEVRSEWCGTEKSQKEMVAYYIDTDQKTNIKYVKCLNEKGVENVLNGKVSVPPKVFLELKSRYVIGPRGSDFTGKGENIYLIDYDMELIAKQPIKVLTNKKWLGEQISELLLKRKELANVLSISTIEETIKRKAEKYLENDFKDLVLRKVTPQMKSAWEKELTERYNMYYNDMDAFSDRKGRLEIIKRFGLDKDIEKEFKDIPNLPDLVSYLDDLFNVIEYLPFSDRARIVEGMNNIKQCDKCNKLFKSGGLKSALVEDESEVRRMQKYCSTVCAATVALPNAPKHIENINNNKNKIELVKQALRAITALPSQDKLEELREIAVEAGLDSPLANEMTLEEVWDYLLGLSPTNKLLSKALKVAKGEITKARVAELFSGFEMDGPKSRKARCPICGILFSSADKMTKHALSCADEQTTDLMRIYLKTVLGKDLLTLRKESRSEISKYFVEEKINLKNLSEFIKERASKSYEDELENLIDQIKEIRKEYKDSNLNKKEKDQLRQKLISAFRNVFKLSIIHKKYKVSEENRLNIAQGWLTAKILFDLAEVIYPQTKFKSVHQILQLLSGAVEDENIPSFKEEWNTYFNKHHKKQSIINEKIYDLFNKLFNIDMIVFANQKQIDEITNKIAVHNAMLSGGTIGKEALIKRQSQEQKKMNEIITKKLQEIKNYDEQIERLTNNPDIDEAERNNELERTNFNKSEAERQLDILIEDSLDLSRVQGLIPLLSGLDKELREVVVQREDEIKNARTQKEKTAINNYFDKKSDRIVKKMQTVQSEIDSVKDILTDLYKEQQMMQTRLTTFSRVLKDRITEYYNQSTFLPVSTPDYKGLFGLLVEQKGPEILTIFNNVNADLRELNKDIASHQRDATLNILKRLSLLKKAELAENKNYIYKIAKENGIKPKADLKVLVKDIKSKVESTPLSVTEVYGDLNVLGSAKALIYAIARHFNIKFDDRTDLRKIVAEILVVNEDVSNRWRDFVKKLPKLVQLKPLSDEEKVYDTSLGLYPVPVQTIVSETRKMVSELNNVLNEGALNQFFTFLSATFAPGISIELFGDNMQLDKYLGSVLSKINTYIDYQNFEEVRSEIKKQEVAAIRAIILEKNPLESAEAIERIIESELRERGFLKDVEMVKLFFVRQAMRQNLKMAFVNLGIWNYGTLEQIEPLVDKYSKDFFTNFSESYIPQHKVEIALNPDERPQEGVKLIGAKKTVNVDLLTRSEVNFYISPLDYIRSKYFTGKSKKEKLSTDSIYKQFGLILEYGKELDFHTAVLKMIISESNSFSTGKVKEKIKRYQVTEEKMKDQGYKKIMKLRKSEGIELPPTQEELAEEIEDQAKEVQARMALIKKRKEEEQKLENEYEAYYKEQFKKTAEMDQNIATIMNWLESKFALTRTIRITKQGPLLGSVVAKGTYEQVLEKLDIEEYMKLQRKFDKEVEERLERAEEERKKRKITAEEKEVEIKQPEDLLNKDQLEQLRVLGDPDVVEVAEVPEVPEVFEEKPSEFGADFDAEFDAEWNAVVEEMGLEEDVFEPENIAGEMADIADDDDGVTGFD